MSLWSKEQSFLTWSIECHCMNIFSSFGVLVFGKSPPGTLLNSLGLQDWF
ncbi:hypothetical protein Lalb_Chr21g0315411 [Lupinus albus]|uniref:Uncharacterized protein n=1 Tax=Lupinus albus TaxID=3870 RepID=A0A6A4NU54_LUPAL|nr:hypothetical protein Lalb_Chr21g0315411 [Lupinus albus]